MALTQNITVTRRGAPRGNAFGYYVAPGETIFAGSLVGVNSSGQLVRIQTSGMSAFVGLAQSGLSNAGNANASSTAVNAALDTYALTVPSATAANINQKVYATDDGTLTLTQPTSGFEGMVGFLVGIDCVTGQTYVQLSGH